MAKTFKSSMLGLQELVLVVVNKVWQYTQDCLHHS